MNEVVLKKMEADGRSFDDVQALNKSGTTKLGTHWRLDFGRKIGVLSEDGHCIRAEYYFNKEYKSTVATKINDPAFKLSADAEAELSALVRSMDEWCHKITNSAIGLSTFFALGPITELVGTGIAATLGADGIIHTREFNSIVDGAVEYARIKIGAALKRDDKLFAKWATSAGCMEYGYLADAIRNSLISRTCDLYSWRKEGSKAIDYFEEVWKGLRVNHTEVGE